LSTAEEAAAAINVLREHTSSVSSLAASHNMLYSGSLECQDIFYRAIEDTSSSESEVECVRVSQHSDSIL
jgi:two-component sensor histidine kinase